MPFNLASFPVTQANALLLQRLVGNKAVSQLLGLHQLGVPSVGRSRPVVQRNTIGVSLFNSFNDQTRATKVQKLAAALKINALNLMNALLDPAFDVVGLLNLGLPLRTIQDSLANPLTYSSCYPTAQTLFPLLGTAGAAVAQGTNLDAYPSGQAFRQEVNALIASMQASVNQGIPSIFRIEYAGHGFSLIARPQVVNGAFQVEHIESLAHSASLLESLPKPAFNPPDVYRHLTDMADDNTDTRVAGAAAMGWNANALYLGRDPAHGNRVDFPGVRMKWWATALNPGWAAAWDAQIQVRFNALAAWQHINDRLP